MSSKIEWTDETWNPVTGCDRVSPGCDHCYAETIAKRFGGPDGFKLKLHPDRLDKPLHWRKPRRVFVNSMSDLFHPGVPDEFIKRVFFRMACTPQHTYQILTKRPQRMAEFMRAAVDAWGNGEMVIMPNVWLGVSVENQRYADLRIPHLLQTPAAVRFLSCEPLLGPIDLRAHLTGWCPEHDIDGGFCVQRYHLGVNHIDWVIVGGESGNGARPMEADWVRALRDQCDDNPTAFFFKQWGGRTPKANGRVLDGRTWDEYPRSLEPSSA